MDNNCGASWLGFRKDPHFLFCRGVALKLRVQFLIFRTESLLKNLEVSGAFPSINGQEDVGLSGRAQQFGTQIALRTPEESCPISVGSICGDEFPNVFFFNREFPDDDVHDLQLTLFV